MSAASLSPPKLIILNVIFDVNIKNDAPTWRGIIHYIITLHYNAFYSRITVGCSVALFPAVVNISLKTVNRQAVHPNAKSATNGPDCVSAL